MHIFNIFDLSYTYKQESRPEQQPVRDDKYRHSQFICLQ